MSDHNKVIRIDSTAVTISESRMLTAEQFHWLSDVPPDSEWLANNRNPRTRKS